jgi:ABC-2 type transport system permease protein
LPSPETHAPAPLGPLLAKEVREIIGGRALWIMLLLVCPLIGYSFLQALSLYGEASAAGLQSPVLASSLSPLDGILVPTLGAFYVAATLLFPFVAIRAVSHEKESGALRLLVQLPYRASALIGAKFAAVLCAWLLAGIPVLSALAMWMVLGGHLSSGETFNLLVGHLLYGALVGAIALFSAAISESAATAAIVTLAFTIGSWVLDFTVAGRPGLAGWVARLSLTESLRTFEQGLFSLAVVSGMGVAACGFVALAGAWLSPGTPLRSRLLRSAVIGLVSAIAMSAFAQVRLTIDATEDQRNSFPPADQRVLATLRAPLTVTVHLAPEDPRYADLRRNVLAKLERAMPHTAVRLGDGQHGDERYGEVEYVYGDRTDVSRSTSHREILPLLYGLAGVAPPVPVPGSEYPGYPLVANEYMILPWFFGLLPALIALAWWRSRRPPSTRLLAAHQGGQP